MTAPATPRAIVIGGSAGGVEAVSALLAALPAQLAPSVVVVLHVTPDRPSLLPTVFAARCALPTCEVDDKQPLTGGAVFVAPPDYHVMIERDGTLALSRDPAVHYSRPSIDVLFESAADAFGDRVVGILVTGASADGAAGLRAIEAAGGTVVVEDPETAYAAAMPRAALQVTTPVLVAPIAGIAAWLGDAAAGWEGR